MHDFDRRVASHAARQHALVTSVQAAACGGTRPMLEHRVATGRWRKVGPGVYRLAGAPVTWQSQLLAAVLAAGPGAMGSHRSAGSSWELDGCRPGAPEIVVPRGRRARLAGVRVHESTDLGLVTPRIVDGIPVTPVARTLLDLGAVVAERRVHVALDSARRRGLTDWDELLDTLVAHARRGRRGVGTLRAILDRHHDEILSTDSGAERLLIALLVQHGLPRPEVQHTVTHASGTFRLDLAYPAERVAIEYDGVGHLARDRWEADHGRQNLVVLEGWTVLRYTRRMYLREPERIVREVRAALERARAAV